MLNNRRHFRLRKQFDVAWSIPEQKVEGDGIVSNISLSGMVFITDRLFKVEDGLGICFRVEQVPSFPSKGKLMWFRKLAGKVSRYQCGVQFLNQDAQHQAWVTWVEETISTLADAENSQILGHILNEGQ